MEVRKRIALTGCLAAALVAAPALTACGGGGGNRADHTGYVQAPADPGRASNGGKVQTPDTKGGKNVGGNSNDGSNGFAEGFERGSGD